MIVLGVEDGNGAGTWVAYGAIVTFVVLLGLVIARSMVLYVFLLIMPIGRVLRRIPGMASIVERLEHAGAGARAEKMKGES